MGGRCRRKKVRKKPKGGIYPNQQTHIARTPIQKRHRAVEPKNTSRVDRTAGIQGKRLGRQNSCGVVLGKDEGPVCRSPLETCRKEAAERLRENLLGQKKKR